MELDREANSETKSDDKIKELNEKLRGIYSEIMSSPSMAVSYTHLDVYKRQVCSGG